MSGKKREGKPTARARKVPSPRRPWVPVAAIVLLCGLCGLLQSASYTLTTYYPSPAGIYDMLTTTARTILARDGGRVGIGTTTPQSRLDILGDDGSGGAGMRGLIVRDTLSDGADKGGVAVLGARKDNEATPFAGLALGDDGISRAVSLGGGGWGLPDATLIRFFTAPAYSESPNQAAERMRVDSNGNVGIGTAGPQKRLHLAGDFRLDNGTLELGELPGDPAAGDSRDGMIYYNTTRNSIRVFEGGTWKDLKRNLECRIVTANEPDHAYCLSDERATGGSCSCGSQIGNKGTLLNNGFECHSWLNCTRLGTAQAVCCRR